MQNRMWNIIIDNWLARLRQMISSTATVNHLVPFPGSDFVIR